MTDRPLISIIIATFNSERTLSMTLESIKKQDYPQKKIEVLAEHYQTQLLIKISPQAGSEIGGVLLREESARNPEIFYTGTVGGKVNFCSERYIYLVELRAR